MEDIFSHFSDIFSDVGGFEELFGGSGFRSAFGGRFTGSGFRSRPMARRGADIRSQLAIPFRDAVLGATREFRVGHGGSAGKTISLKIPRGIRDGAVLRLPSQGQPGQGGGPAGDLLIEIKILPDPQLERDGNHIRSSVKVPLKTAVLGGEVDVATLRGRITLRVPPRTSSDSWLRLKGQGIQSGGRQGDHLVRIVVQVPREVPPELEEALRKMA
jgi:DnaJ-class molecular chaperone